MRLSTVRSHRHRHATDDALTLYLGHQVGAGRFLWKRINRMSGEGHIDRLVEEALFSNMLQNGVFVEVGAAHPTYLSISKRFRDRGWKIISIEPIPEFCDEFRKLGYEVLQFACSDIDADNASFYAVKSAEAQYHDGYVTFESFSSLGVRNSFALQKATVSTQTEIIPVVVRRLDRLLAEYAPDINHIDILSVDVEGWEMEVMRGFDLKKFNPKVIIMENNFSDYEQTEFILSQGYIRWSVVRPNEIFVLPDFLETVCNDLYGPSKFKNWLPVF